MQPEETRGEEENEFSSESKADTEKDEPFLTLLEHTILDKSFFTCLTHELFGRQLCSVQQNKRQIPFPFLTSI